MHLTAPVNSGISRSTGPNWTILVPLESCRRGESNGDSGKARGALVEVHVVFFLYYSCFDPLLLPLPIHSYFFRHSLLITYISWPLIGPLTFIYSIFSYCTVPYIRGQPCIYITGGHHIEDRWSASASEWQRRHPHPRRPTS